MSLGVPFIFAFVIITISLFIICFKCCEGTCATDNTPVYSAPIVVTSQTHVPPGRIVVTGQFLPIPSSQHHLPHQNNTNNIPIPSFSPYSPYPYPQQNGSATTQSTIVIQPSVPQPSAPCPANFSSQDMDMPPNYNEAIRNLSKEKKKY